MAQKQHIGNFQIQGIFRDHFGQFLAESGSKSADELDTPLDVDLAVANERVLQLEKELSECKAELQASKESAVLNHEEAAKLRSENTDLKNIINQLQGENETILSD